MIRYNDWIEAEATAKRCLPAQVRIREVGPRDGFQNEPETIATADKVRLVEMLAPTGLRRLEVTSFVRADVIPQLADGREVLERAEIPDDVSASVLIPNERGLDAALELRDRIDEVNVFLSACESHNRHNVNRSVEESLAGLERVLDRARGAGLRCEGVISTSFGCPYEGDVPAARVFEIAARLAAAGAEEIGFGDTTGMANPAQVREFFERAAAELPGVELTAHFHNTRGQGLANVLAALEAGCESFESSFGELGGCPVPPGATGNVASEDLVSMLEEMGVETGVDLGEAARRRRRGAAGARPPARLAHPGRRPRRLAALMFERVLIANRGEIAVRVDRTLRAAGDRVDRRLQRRRRRRAARPRSPTAPSTSARPPRPQSYLAIERVRRARLPRRRRRRSTPATASSPSAPTSPPPAPRPGSSSSAPGPRRWRCSATRSRAKDAADGGRGADPARAAAARS